VRSYFFSGNFFLKKLKFNTILKKKLLAEPEKYIDAINVIKKYILYEPIKLKKA